MMDVTSVYPGVMLPPADPLPRDLEGACRALEKEFSRIVFGKMREAMALENTAGPDGFARRTAEGMLDDEWAELASQGEGLGLWRALYRQLEPAAVKSGIARADERTREGTHRGEAERDAKGSHRTLGEGVGHSRFQKTSASDQGTPGLPEPKGLLRHDAFRTSRKGV